MYFVIHYLPMRLRDVCFAKILICYNCLSLLIDRDTLFYLLYEVKPSLFSMTAGTVNKKRVCYYYDGTS